MIIQTENNKKSYEFKSSEFKELINIYHGQKWEDIF